MMSFLPLWKPGSGLEREGFVTPMPTSVTGYSTTATYGTEYFISRRGEKIQTLEDYEAFCKADLLRKHQLHHIIAEKVWVDFRARFL